MRATGEIDASNAAALRQHLDAARSDGLTTLLDLSGISFMDASGLRVLLDAARAADADEWAWFLVRPSAAVARLLDVSRAMALLPVVMPDGSTEPARPSAGGLAA